MRQEAGHAGISSRPVKLRIGAKLAVKMIRVFFVVGATTLRIIQGI